MADIRTAKLLAQALAPEDRRRFVNSSDKCLGPPWPDVAHTASLSVIVPVRNEQNFIADTLAQLLAQNRTGFRLEILVVDGCSTDRTRAIVEAIAAKHPVVRLLDNPKKLSSAARNVGIHKSTGKLMVVVDGHCVIPTRTYFLDIIEAFERSKADCLGRPQPLDVADGTVLQRAIAAARSSAVGHHPDSLVYADEESDVPAISVAVAYRRSVFDRVGVFDESFDACEDCELNYRIDAAGLRCRFAPQLAVKYHPRDSLAGLFRQLSRYGRGRVRLFRKHPRSFSPSTLLPALFWTGVVVGPLLCWLMPSLWFAYGAALAVYLMIVLAGSWRPTRARSHSGLVSLYTPVVLVTIHLACAWGVISEFVLGCRPSRKYRFATNRRVR